METMLHARSLGPEPSPYARQLSILYDVQRYTHRSWRDTWKIPPSLPTRTANRLMLARLGDHLPPAADAMITALPVLCLHHWERLPGIAYLLGAYMLRESLIRVGRVAILPWRAADFLHLPLPRYGLRDNGTLQFRLETEGPSDDLLYATGAALLACAWLRPDGTSWLAHPLRDLPFTQDARACMRTQPQAMPSFNRAIYQRLRLLFPETSLRAHPHTPLCWNGPSRHALFLIKTALSHWNAHVQKDCYATG